MSPTPREAQPHPATNRGWLKLPDVVHLHRKVYATHNCGLLHHRPLAPRETADFAALTGNYPHSFQPQKMPRSHSNPV